jgi:hypothetical protein
MVIVVFLSFPKKMKRIAIVAGLLLSLCRISDSQNLTSSNLPVIIISTDGGVWIPDSYRVLGTMKIIFRGSGQRNYVSDQTNPAYLNYNGRIDIETRGSSSQATEKKQYGFSTLKADNISDNNVSLLGMPAEHDWILNGMVWDTARIRDYLCFNLMRELGEYASRAIYCEVVINGSYRGLYLLEEKIKWDNGRVDIMKLEPSENAQPELSGGYIVKADKTTGGDPVAWSMVSWYNGPVDYIHHLPKPEDITSTQSSYLRNYFMKFASAAQGGNTSLYNGYTTYIDIPSFIHYIIIAELASNADSYGLSTYFHKDRNGKLRAGPMWDSDLTFGNDLFLWGYDRSHTNVWQLHDGGNDGSKFWYDLFQNSQFRCYLSKRWNSVTQPGQPLNLTNLENFVDQTVSTISEAITRDYARWGIANNHSQRIANLKAWTAERITWMTTNLGSYSACSNVNLPPLVISKINFNPPASVWFPDGEELEFIEITNTGDAEVNLSGIYFGGTGLVYQFPYNSQISADTSIYLASNSSVFYNKYGFMPFGQYTRHISNSGQDLQLLDAFGNSIDNVSFSDTLPWPEADGNGFYLKLKDTSLDNNSPENWIASNDLILSSDEIKSDAAISLYPNPVHDVLHLRADRIMLSLEIHDMTGHLLISANAGTDSYDLNLESLPSGVYILKVVTPGRMLLRKIVRY